MVGSVGTYLKKIFSLTLIFNCLMTIVGVAGIFVGFYRAFPYWRPYWPYLIDVNFFWLVILGALVNVFPCASIGRALHTGRFLFHHYVYGFFVLLSSSAFVVAFTSVSLLSLFLVNTTSVEVNFGRCIALVGLTLFLDDLPDVSKRVESFLNWLKSRAYQVRKAIHLLQLFTGSVSLYLFVAITVWTIQNPERAFINSFLMGTLLITSLISFICVRRKTWLKITIIK
jgi:hypothetical protein